MKVNSSTTSFHVWQLSYIANKCGSTNGCPRAGLKGTKWFLMSNNKRKLLLTLKAFVGDVLTVSSIELDFVELFSKTSQAEPGCWICCWEAPVWNVTKFSFHVNTQLTINSSSINYINNQQIYYQQDCKNTRTFLLMIGLKNPLILSKFESKWNGKHYSLELFSLLLSKENLNLDHLKRPEPGKITMKLMKTYSILIKVIQENMMEMKI